MAANAEPIYWSETVEAPDDEEILDTRGQILHVRYRVGDYVVTRLILDSRDTPETSGK